MDQAEYRKRVIEAYQGEVEGEELFVAMAAKYENPEQRYKMRVLAQLELETKERLRPLVENLGAPTAEDASRRARGAKAAAALSSRPWPDLMRLFKPELVKFIAGFEQLQNGGRPQDAEVLAHLTAHERSLLAFVERELGGEPATSLEPVIALLHRVPAK